uniref:Aminopeptidase n=2 Tax=Eptatretus burgeri TaxID=7764 RepID=A0A8C4QJV6_EPTBU
MENKTKRPFQVLPKDVRPTNYALSLQPDLELFNFLGNVDIDVQVKCVTSQVVMNSVDIDIISATYTPGSAIDGETATELTATGINYQNEDEKVTLTFSSALALGNGKLRIDYTGELNDKMKGFYRSKYRTPDGETRYAAVTHLEPSYARSVLPCWDEPAIKVTFDVTLVVPEGRLALSNMNETGRRPCANKPGLVEVSFARTPIMSTYLLAAVVGEYDFVEGRTSDGTHVRVFTPLGKADHGHFALEVAIKTIPFYTQYFDVPYPLPKIDLIAIADFSVGAMENWGLVTYRELALLVDPKSSSSEARQSVALVVGHELAHQWFGNLVTMEWWTHLWLNEGFATWIEYLCVDHCFQDFHIWTQFVAKDHSRALDSDGLENSHPVEVEVGNPGEVNEIFDAISYSKGASIIRMLHAFIGDAAFRKGLHLYLTKFEYRNAATEDLWACLEESSGQPVAAIMRTWTTQLGYPVLHVSDEQQGEDRILNITQEKFCAGGTFKGDSPTWMVPITISTGDNPSEVRMTVLLEKQSTRVTIPGLQANQWVKLNSGTVGFYRTCYSQPMLKALIPAIRDQSLPPCDRLSIQDDLIALSCAGVVSAADVLRVMEAYMNEPDFTVWMSLNVNVSSIAVLLINTDCFSSFQSYVVDLFTPVGKRLGWEAITGEGHLDAMLRTTVLDRLGRYGHRPTLAEAKRRFSDHVEGRRTLPVDMRRPVYIAVLRHGDASVMDTILKMFRETDELEEKHRIQMVLGAASSSELLQRALDFSLSEEVRSQDTVFVIASVAGQSRLGMGMAWDFVRENWMELNGRYQGTSMLGHLVWTAGNFASEERALEVKAFFDTHPVPSAERAVQQAMENIRLNAAWLERDGAALKAFLEERSTRGGDTSAVCA